MAKRRFDVIIVGGGVMGAAIAYHLLKEGIDGKVAILEKDPTYEYATTPRSAGGVRQQFTSEINIRIGLFCLERFLRFDEEMEVEGEPAHADFKQVGYLFLANEENFPSLKTYHQLQKALGAEVELLGPDGIKEVFPPLNVEGVVGGSWGPEAGYVDPYGVLQGYLRKARSLGLTYLHEEVVELLREGGRMRGVKTKRGEVIEGGCVVLTAGAWSGELAKTAGISLPVEPLPRMAYCFRPAERFSGSIPMIIDPNDLYFRGETGGLVLTGKSREEVPGFRFQWDRDFFFEEIWPSLAKWVPSFERLRLIRGWCGLYEMCSWDRNGLVGEYPGIEGLFLATGFSGHGLQQAPAVGQCMAELILTGTYRSLDLSPLDVGRIFRGVKVEEEGIV